MKQIMGYLRSLFVSVAVVLTVVFGPSVALATGTPYDGIISSADYSGVSAGVGTVAAAIGAVLVIIAGASILLGFLRKR